jgi:hypothetical protein
MKNFLKLIIIFILSLKVYCGEYIWLTDLDNDGKKERIEVYTKQDSFYLKIDKIDYNLNSKSIYSIVDEKNRDHVIVFFDADWDSTLEIAICTEHPLFSNKSILKVLKYQNNSLKPLYFYYNLDDSSSQLISLKKINIWDSTNNSLYVITGRKGYNASNSEMVFFYKVEQYKWNSTVRKIIKIGEKYYKNINRRTLFKLIF